MEETKLLCSFHHSAINRNKKIIPEQLYDGVGKLHLIILLHTGTINAYRSYRTHYPISVSISAVTDLTGIHYVVLIPSYHFPRTSNHNTSVNSLKCYWGLCFSHRFAAFLKLILNGLNNSISRGSRA